MQVVVLKHPKAIAAKPERKLDIDLKTFEHLARRILSTSSNGDQARAIAELMKYPAGIRSRRLAPVTAEGGDEGRAMSLSRPISPFRMLRA